MKSNLSVFSLTDEAFYVISLKSLPNTRSERFSPEFDSRNFLVLGFILSSVKLFMLMFKNGVPDEWSFCLYICNSGYFRFTCWKDCPSPLSWVCFWLCSSPKIFVSPPLICVYTFTDTILFYFYIHGKSLFNPLLQDVKENFCDNLESASPTSFMLCWEHL